MIKLRIVLITCYDRFWYLGYSLIMAALICLAMPYPYILRKSFEHGKIINSFCYIICWLVIWIYYQPNIICCLIIFISHFRTVVNCPSIPPLILHISNPIRMVSVVGVSVIKELTISNIFKWILMYIIK